MPTLFAYDCSGSTSGLDRYHHLAQEIFKKEKARDNDITIVAWDDNLRVLTGAELAEMNRTRTGYGWTDTATVANYVKEKEFHGRLVLITDGQVPQECVHICTKVLGMGWSFSSTEVHLIETIMSVNLSVPCPFTRNTPHIVYHYKDDNTPQPIVEVTQQDLAVLEAIKTIGNVKQFQDHKDTLEKVVRARTMGTDGDTSLRDSILAMKKRIIKNQAKALGTSQTVADMIAAVQSSAPNALELAHKVTMDYYASEASETDWIDQIVRLVSMCEGALKGAFDLSGIDAAIQSDRARRAEQIETVTTEKPPAASNNAEKKKKNVGLEVVEEDDMVLLVVDEGPAVMENRMPFKTVNDITNCPLNALAFPEVVDRIKVKLDHPIPLKDLKGLTKSPVTGRPITGAICLGCNREQERFSTSTIAKIISGGKALGNADLWFAVVWRIIESGDLPHLDVLIPHFRAQMKWRCTNDKTNMALSGLPTLPTTRVPVGVAAWYVVAASALSLPPHQEPMRAHISHGEHLIAIVDLMGYKLPPNVDFQAYVRRLRLMSEMLKAIKKDRMLFPYAINALYQNSVAIDRSNVSERVKELELVPAFIPLDGPATESSRLPAVAELQPQWRNVPIKELVVIASLVDPQLSVTSVPFPLDFMPYADKEWATTFLPAIEWCYGLKKYRSPENKICLATCRPFFMKAGRPWALAAKRYFGFPAHDQWSLNQAYGNFVCKYGKYPTQDEMLVFTYNRAIKSTKKRKSTLPFLAGTYICETIQRYSEASSKLSPEEFAMRFAATANVEIRKNVEGPYRHEVDKDSKWWWPFSWGL